ncbi:MAG: hypothetical protein K2J04_08145, partial [Lachnospiraceae bacterium]|nr:hypothetical protein [Lachnospiraceae bacterium]
MKLLEMPQVPDDSLSKKVTMLDNFLPMIQNITLPVLLINGKYDPACTKYQTEYMMENVQNMTQVTLEETANAVIDGKTILEMRE